MGVVSCPFLCVRDKSSNFLGVAFCLIPQLSFEFAFLRNTSTMSFYFEERINLFNAKIADDKGPELFQKISNIQTMNSVWFRTFTILRAPEDAHVKILLIFGL